MTKPPFSGRIREESPTDIPAIFEMTQAAFEDRTFSSGTEGPIIDALREQGDLTLSLVAETDGKIVGQITFSPAAVGRDADGIFALGPVAVQPELRHQRIGAALIEAGLERLKGLGAKACVLVGDPSYYSRYGFMGDCGLTSGEVPALAVQILTWDGKTRRGEITFAPAFSSTPSPA